MFFFNFIIPHTCAPPPQKKNLAFPWLGGKGFFSKIFNYKKGGGGVC